MHTYTHIHAPLHAHILHAICARINIDTCFMYCSFILDGTRKDLCIRPVFAPYLFKMVEVSLPPSPPDFNIAKNLVFEVRIGGRVFVTRCFPAETNWHFRTASNSNIKIGGLNGGSDNHFSIMSPNRKAYAKTLPPSVAPSLVLSKVGGGVRGLSHSEIAQYRNSTNPPFLNLRTSMSQTFEIPTPWNSETL